MLENEVRFLLGSEQIRDPAPYNAVLGAIASGETQFGGIQQQTGTERGVLSFHLKTLLDLGWIRREFPFGETSDRRALYQVADPFLAFWYRFVAPLASALQFSDPQRVYAERVAPFLADYMGWNVFEAICHQWLQRHAQERLGLTIRRMGRYWSRDGRTELDIVAELDGGTFLFGECKWSANAAIGLSVYAGLKAKVQSLPEAKWRNKAACVLFAVGGFAPELRTLAAQPEERLYLVEGSGPAARSDTLTGGRGFGHGRGEEGCEVGCCTADRSLMQQKQSAAMQHSLFTGYAGCTRRKIRGRMTTETKPTEDAGADTNQTLVAVRPAAGALSPFARLADIPEEDLWLQNQRSAQPAARTRRTCAPLCEPSRSRAVTNYGARAGERSSPGCARWSRRKRRRAQPVGDCPPYFII